MLASSGADEGVFRGVGLMRYMGSKRRIAKHILPIMLAAASERGITRWVEPFVGGGNSIDKVPQDFERIGYDLNEHAIMAMLDIRDRAESLPDTVTEAEYKAMRGTPPATVTSWARFVCAFGADFECGYARYNLPRYKKTPAQEALASAIKQQPKLQGVKFVHGGYDLVNETNALIYCDPPYQNTSGYKTGAFDSVAFFEWCRQQAKRGNIVFVSEYEAPADFEIVWQGEVKTNFTHRREAATHHAVERLYRVS